MNGIAERFTERLLIGGKLVRAERGNLIDNINPATEETIGAVPDGDASDMERAICAARRAFDRTDWATDTELRLRCLIQLRDALEANIEALRSLYVAETGCPVSQTSGIALDEAIRYLDHYIGLLENYEFERTLPTKRIMGLPADRIIRREAAGVVGVITPWNYPFYLNLCKVGATLAAGCTVVLKPAPDTPWSALALGRIALEHTDIPAGVLNIVSTGDNGVAQILAAHPDVDAITLTGSTATGRRVMSAAADTVKRVTLELGGKCAAVLLDEADFDTIVPGYAAGACIHAGQGCTQVTRMLVPRRRLSETIERAEAAMMNVPWGDPTDPVNIMGPVINEVQRDKVLHYYKLAAQGGRIVVGGKPTDRFGKGYFVEPTLITDVDPKSAVAQEEIFGPALVVLPYDDEEEALRIADGTLYGLSTTVFGAPDRAMGFARQFRTGTVSVNGAQWFDVESPFGGYKQSGLGREWGTEGFEEFLEIKTIAYPAIAG